MHSIISPRRSLLALVMAGLFVGSGIAGCSFADEESDSDSQQQNRDNEEGGDNSQNNNTNNTNNTTNNGQPEANHSSTNSSHGPPGNDSNSDYADEEAGQPPEDSHNDFGENVFIDTAEEDTSTFSIDVNAASYTMMRQSLQNGYLPNPEGVRTEEFINFFRFNYPEPTDDPFSVNMEIAPSHFGSTTDQPRHLLRVGMKGKDVSIEDMKPTNLVFLVDVSGSMSGGNRLPLAQDAMHVMLDYLRDTDSIAMQTYASGSDTVLEPTTVSNRADIEEAIDSLYAEGSTNGEGGIVDAYDMAEEAFIEGGNNRVVILTDGGFNVGKTGDDLIDLVKSYRDREISLTSIGFGTGGYNDATMEELARRGSGNYFFVDSSEEANRIFGPDLPSTIEVIAQDVRTQIEFNAEAVDRYRLIGYEKRVMENEEFDDEDADAGEIGPGHTVTAFYELELHEDGLENTSFLAEVRVNHREQYGEELLHQNSFIKHNQMLDDFNDASDGFRFAAAVAEFAGVLRESEFVQGDNFDDIYDVAEAAVYADDDGQQAEFLDLVELAEDLWGSQE